MQALWSAAPGVLSDAPSLWDWDTWEAHAMRVCVICGDDRDVEWTDVGWACRSWLACERRWKAQEKAPTTEQPASMAVVSA